MGYVAFFIMFPKRKFAKKTHAADSVRLQPRASFRFEHELWGRGNKNGLVCRILRFGTFPGRKPLNFPAVDMILLCPEPILY